jgi:hypothetical protein
VIYYLVFQELLGFALLARLLDCLLQQLLLPLFLQRLDQKQIFQAPGLTIILLQVTSL